MNKIFSTFCAAFAALLVTSASVAGTELPQDVIDKVKSEIAATAQAKFLIDTGQFDQAREILAATPFDVMEMEIERLHLIAQTYMAQRQYNQAIVIYRHILDNQPNLSKIRAELAIAYMNQQDWYRADYHIRLAMADNKIPDSAMAELRGLLYFIRKNKNWDVWFNFSASPDSNPNQSRGGEECLIFMGMYLCRQIPEPEKAFGFHTSFGGNYEFKINEKWGIKSDLAVYTSFYDHSQYNSIYLRASTGPRYVWSDGEIWGAAVVSRRFYGNHEYNYSIGGKIDIWQDLTNSVGMGLQLQYQPTWYDDFGEFLDGTTYSITPRLTYIINPALFLNFNLSLDKETTRDSSYSNHKIGAAVGIGAEVFYGFRIYAEPFVTFVPYDAPRLVVKDYTFAAITEKDWLFGANVSISNNKINMMGFTPALLYRYTRRESNIWQREYSKHSIELQIQRRF